MFTTLTNVWLKVTTYHLTQTHFLTQTRFLTQQFIIEVVAKIERILYTRSFFSFYIEVS